MYQNLCVMVEELAAWYFSHNLKLSHGSWTIAFPFLQVWVHEDSSTHTVLCVALGIRIGFSYNGPIAFSFLRLEDFVSFHLMVLEYNCTRLVCMACFILDT